MSMREAGAGTVNYRGTAGQRDEETRRFRESMKKRTQDNFETSSQNQARSQQNSEHARKAVEHAKQVQTQVQQVQTQPPEQKKQQGDMVIESPSKAYDRYMNEPKDFKQDQPSTQPSQAASKAVTNDEPKKDPQMFADKYKLNLINSGATK